ncbi:VOC family protein [Bradyrhizobium genosp. L]|uniref:VOC family protein n=1 Tax=Bradyrhizobium genosp. L TaxID=83637 RepID=UPI0018A2E719|nr:VOC family protein [Bradyrhizobium genosp. L]QPF85935.1 VOC family protein [Bradyrhizobium genosp. L]
MHLKHLNLATSDVGGLAGFFQRHFAFKSLLERGAGAFTILRNDDGFVLTLMKLKKADPESYPETFHLGLYVEDRDAVEAKRGELVAAGLSPQPIQEAGRSGRGAHFYCTAPGGILVEIATPPDPHEA